MTDFKTLYTSTDYAIRGFYKHLYNYIPKKVRLHYNMDEAVSCMGAFYDPNLTFENRLKYKVTSIKYADRKSPWIALMWNNEGLQPAENHFRRFDVRLDIDGRIHTGKACYVRTLVNIGIVSNSKTALDEFQEVFLLNVRPEDWSITAEHPYLKDFTINIMDFSMTQVTKLERNEGTLALAVATMPIQFPIVGCIDDSTGIIQTINTTIKNYTKETLTNFSITSENQ